MLITGFGPYPGVRDNPSGKLMQEVARRIGRSFHGVQAAGVELTVRYSRSRSELAAADDAFQPDAVLLLGLAARARRVRVEQFARGLDSPLQLDAAGAGGAGGSGRRSGAMPLRASGRVLPALAALRSAGISVHLSASAGRYLCNAVYAAALDRAAGRPVLFVHVPYPRPAPGAVPLHRSRAHRPRQAPLAAALSRIALNLVLQARRTRLAQFRLA